MSSVDSYLNSATTIYVHDFYRRFYRPHADEGQMLLIGRWTTIGFVLWGVYFAFQMMTFEAGIYSLFQTLMSFVVGPTLGVLMAGMLSSRTASEGALPGFGWIPGKTKAFPRGQGLKIPHMGWNVARVLRASPFTANLGEEPRFYFVHSYYVTCDRPDDALLSTNYGVEFVSALHHDNIYGAQFHPEKSHKFGMRLFENFVHL